MGNCYNGMQKKAGVRFMFYFIVNPHARSGQGINIWKKAEGFLAAEDTEYEVFFTKYTGHARELARQIAVLSLPCTLTVLGGDGTLNEVIDGLASQGDFSHITLGYIPTGSGNDFARGLGIPSDVTACMRAILSPSAFALADVGVSRTSQRKRHFLVSSGIGYDADICLGVMKTPAKKFLNRLRLGKLTYVYVALKLLLKYQCCPVSVRIDKKEIYRLPRFYFLAAMNMKQEGGGVRFCPRARYQDGLLDICLVGDIPKAKILALFPTAFVGKHTGFKGIHMYRCRRIDIISRDPLPIHCDGESMGYHRHLTISDTQKQIKVILK